MANKKNYSHDHTVLLLGIFSIFFSTLSIIIIVIRLISENHATYFIQYRPTLGLNSFQTGNLLDILSFIVMSLVVMVSSIYISYRSYYINRNFSIAVLSSGIFLGILILLVSNSLLGLH